MKESYSAYSGFTPEDHSDIMIRLMVLAGEIYKEQANAEYILRQMFPTTAVGEYLDRHAAERGLSRKAATKATGYVYFYPEDETHDDILIPSGTVVCTYTDMRRFITDRDTVLRSGADRVMVAVTAAEEGAAYNVRGGTISIIVTPVIGIGRVYNGSVFTNGADTETDDALRERIFDSYVNISNGTNAAYYKALAMSVSGVRSASVIGCARGAGTVDVYVLGDGVPVPASVRDEVQELLTRGRELNVDVLVKHPQEVDISLYIRLSVDEGYDFAEVSSAVRSAVTEYIDGLGIGKDVLLSDIGDMIYHIKGVRDYKFLENYGSDTAVRAYQYPVADNVIVNEAS